MYKFRWTTSGQSVSNSIFSSSPTPHIIPKSIFFSTLNFYPFPMSTVFPLLAVFSPTVFPQQFPLYFLGLLDFSTLSTGLIIIINYIYT